MTKISVKGTIVADDDKWIYDWLDIQSVCPADIHRAIAEAGGGDLEIEINSGGGDILAGNEIYTALRMYRGKVTNMIVGIAASAASYIASARYCMMTPVGIYMIHNAFGGARGDYHAMDKESEILQTVNQAITAAYMEKTKMSQEELLKLMDNETWLTAKKAVEYGFVDTIIENQECSQQANSNVGFFNSKNSVELYNTTQILDRKTIEKTKDMLAKTFGNSKGTALANDALSSPEDVYDHNQFSMKRKGEKMEETQENISTAEELTAKYPAFAQQIMDRISLEAKSAENLRLKAIDEIAGQIPDVMVKEAKYGEKRITAETLAFEAFKRNKIMAAETFLGLKNDIKDSGTEEVGADANTGFADDNEELRATKINNLALKLKRKQR